MKQQIIEMLIKESNGNWKFFENDHKLNVPVACIHVTKGILGFCPVEVAELLLSKGAVEFIITEAEFNQALLKNELSKDVKPNPNKEEVVTLVDWFNYSTQQMVQGKTIPIDPNKVIEVRFNSKCAWNQVVVVGRTLNGKYMVQAPKGSASTQVMYADFDAIFRPLDWDKFKPKPLTTSQLFIKDLDEIFESLSNDDFDSEEEYQETVALKMINKGWIKK
ncbi:MAG: hypothetical protein CMC55_08715 [Flavobacteriaceae bacterium]|nr:hypothetical protein [Flavobacteriaceae bacterium]